mmetsp:Transcript_49/g.130  ORF Transcript_49/g.130 Transcript_49/m.130 type:complete len:500 (-) Transcript_49:19-1518(-)
MAQSLPTNNAQMIEELVLHGTLKTPSCIAAFSAVDRARFWTEELGALIYADMPLRTGHLHLSAPQIYAQALESLLPINPGMSFLNVGSGTGYFNCIMSQLLGLDSTNHGIDIWQEVVDYAEEHTRAMDNVSVTYHLGNVYQMDVNKSMRYDRIYLGACANSRSKYLYGLLEVGGVLVGPFQAGRTQQLRRVVRRSEKYFSIEILETVRFAPLVEPSAALLTDNAVASPAQSGLEACLSPTHAEETIQCPGLKGGKAYGLTGVPFTFSLREKPWTIDRAADFPQSFRDAVGTCLLCSHRQNLLPTGLWLEHIFTWCPKWWFDPQHPTNLTDSSMDYLAETGLAAPEPSALALPLPCKLPAEDCKEDSCDADECSSDSGTRSTRASSSASSQESSPGARELIEVYGNGQHHTIGSGGDPDDVGVDHREAGIYSAHILHILLRAHQRQDARVALLEMALARTTSLDEDEQVPPEGSRRRDGEHSSPIAVRELHFNPPYRIIE